MKKLFNPLLIFLALALAVIQPVAQAQTYNITTSVKEGFTYARYTGTIDMDTEDGDSIASHYTQPFFIGNSNQGIGIVTVTVPDSTGTEDINLFVEYSNDLTNWKSISTAVKDQMTAGVTYDTLSTVGGTALIEFKSSIWARLHFDGQASNPGNILTWEAYMPKNTGAPTSNSTFVQNSN